jgi:rod shape-determining protein MreC
MPVVAGDGLVGRVVQAARSTSEVLLILDPSSAVAGRLTASGETGVVEGHGDDLRFELLSPHARVAVGDPVVTAGYDRGVYPPGVPIGRVARIPRSRTSVAPIVELRPTVDFARLDYVLVVTAPRRGRRP